MVFNSNTSKPYFIPYTTNLHRAIHFTTENTQASPQSYLFQKTNINKKSAELSSLHVEHTSTAKTYNMEREKIVNNQTIKHTKYIGKTKKNKQSDI